METSTRPFSPTISVYTDQQEAAQAFSSTPPSNLPSDGTVHSVPLLQRINTLVARFMDDINYEELKPAKRVDTLIRLLTLQHRVEVHHEKSTSKNQKIRHEPDQYQMAVQLTNPSEVFAPVPPVVLPENTVSFAQENTLSDTTLAPLNFPSSSQSPMSEDELFEADTPAKDPSDNPSLSCEKPATFTNQQNTTASLSTSYSHDQEVEAPLSNPELKILADSPASNIARPGQSVKKERHTEQTRRDGNRSKASQKGSPQSRRRKKNKRGHQRSP